MRMHQYTLRPFVTKLPILIFLFFYFYMKGIKVPRARYIRLLALFLCYSCWEHLFGLVFLKLVLNFWLFYWLLSSCFYHIQTSNESLTFTFFLYHLSHSIWFMCHVNVCCPQRFCLFVAGGWGELMFLRKFLCIKPCKNTFHTSEKLYVQKSSH